MTRACISSHHEDIQRAERQIQDLECQIAALRENIAHIRDDIARKEAFIAPIRRLPFDVLGEVAVILATDPSADVQVLRTLASVCRVWRDATLRTPRAWSTIIFLWTPPDPRFPRKRLCTLRDLDEWFTRSGACPKDVYLNLGDMFGHMPSSEVDALCGLLRERTSELHSLSIWFHDHEDRSLRIKDCLSTQPFPLLEHLDFSSSVQLLDRAARNSLINMAPRLTRLTVADLQDHVVHALRMRIKSLDIRTTTLLKLLDKLRSDDGLPMLRSLNVHNMSLELSVPDNAMPFIETRLLILCMGFNDPATPTLFRLLGVPHLQKLALVNGNYGTQSSKKDAFAMFDSLMTTSNPPLSELYLQKILLSDGDLLKLLTRLPLLQRLVIHDAKTSDKVCEGLSTRRPKLLGWICRRLTHFCISTERGTKSDKFRVSRSAMQQLAEARRSDDAVSTLIAVRLETFTLYRIACSWQWTDDPTEGLSNLSYRENSLREHLPATAWWHVPAGPDIMW